MGQNRCLPTIFLVVPLLVISLIAVGNALSLRSGENREGGEAVVEIAGSAPLQGSGSGEKRAAAAGAPIVSMQQLNPQQSATGVSGALPDPTQSPWISGPEGKRYQFNSGAQSWLTAREYCLRQNADLVSVDGGQHELDWLLDHYKPELPNTRERQIQVGLMLETGRPNAVSPIARFSAYREWRWVNTKAVDNTLLPWAEGEPFDHSHQGRERCALLNVNARRLVDVDCDADAQPGQLPYRFICERTREKHLEHESLNNPLWRKLEDILVFFGMSTAETGTGKNSGNKTATEKSGSDEDYWERQKQNENGKKGEGEKKPIAQASSKEDAKKLLEKGSESGGEHKVDAKGEAGQKEKSGKAEEKVATRRITSKSEEGDLQKKPVEKKVLSSEESDLPSKNANSIKETDEKKKLPERDTKPSEVKPTIEGGASAGKQVIPEAVEPKIVPSPSNKSKEEKKEETEPQKQQETVLVGDNGGREGNGVVSARGSLNDERFRGTQQIEFKLDDVAASNPGNSAQQQQPGIAHQAKNDPEALAPRVGVVPPLQSSSGAQQEAVSANAAEEVRIQRDSSISGKNKSPILAANEQQKTEQQQKQNAAIPSNADEKLTKLPEKSSVPIEPAKSAPAIPSPSSDQPKQGASDVPISEILSSVTIPKKSENEGEIKKNEVQPEKIEKSEGKKQTESEKPPLSQNSPKTDESKQQQNQTPPSASASSNISEPNKLPPSQPIAPAEGQAHWGGRSSSSSSSSSSEERRRRRNRCPPWWRYCPPQDAPEGSPVNPQQQTEQQQQSTSQQQPAGASEAAQQKLTVPAEEIGQRVMSSSATASLSGASVAAVDQQKPTTKDEGAQKANEPQQKPAKAEVEQKQQAILEKQEVKALPVAPSPTAQIQQQNTAVNSEDTKKEPEVATNVNVQSEAEKRQQQPIQQKESEKANNSPSISQQKAPESAPATPPKPSSEAVSSPIASQNVASNLPSGASGNTIPVAEVPKKDPLASLADTLEQTIGKGVSPLADLSVNQLLEASSSSNSATSGVSGAGAIRSNNNSERIQNLERIISVVQKMIDNTATAQKQPVAPAEEKRPEASSPSNGQQNQQNNGGIIVKTSDASVSVAVATPEQQNASQKDKVSPSSGNNSPQQQKALDANGSNPNPTKEENGKAATLSESQREQKQSSLSDPLDRGNQPIDEQQQQRKQAIIEQPLIREGENTPKVDQKKEEKISIPVGENKRDQQQTDQSPRKSSLDMLLQKSSPGNISSNSVESALDVEADFVEAHQAEKANPGLNSGDLVKTVRAAAKAAKIQSGGSGEGKAKGPIPLDPYGLELFTGVIGEKSADPGEIAGELVERTFIEPELLRLASKGGAEVEKSSGKGIGQTLNNKLSGEKPEATEFDPSATLRSLKRKQLAELSKLAVQELAKLSVPPPKAVEKSIDEAPVGAEGLDRGPTEELIEAVLAVQTQAAFKKPMKMVKIDSRQMPGYEDEQKSNSSMSSSSFSKPLERKTIEQSHIDEAKHHKKNEERKEPGFSEVFSGVILPVQSGVKTLSLDTSETPRRKEVSKAIEISTSKGEIVAKKESFAGQLKEVPFPQPPPHLTIMEVNGKKEEKNASEGVQQYQNRKQEVKEVKEVKELAKPKGMVPIPMSPDPYAARKKQHFDDEKNQQQKFTVKEEKIADSNEARNSGNKSTQTEWTVVTSEVLRVSPAASSPLNSSVNNNSKSLEPISGSIQKIPQAIDKNETTTTTTTTTTSKPATTTTTTITLKPTTKDAFLQRIEEQLEKMSEIINRIRPSDNSTHNTLLSNQTIIMSAPQKSEKETGISPSTKEKPTEEVPHQKATTIVQQNSSSVVAPSSGSNNTTESLKMLKMEEDKATTAITTINPKAAKGSVKNEEKGHVKKKPMKSKKTSADLPEEAIEDSSEDDEEHHGVRSTTTKMPVKSTTPIEEVMLKEIKEIKSMIGESTLKNTILDRQPKSLPLAFGSLSPPLLPQQSPPRKSVGGSERLLPMGLKSAEEIAAALNKRTSDEVFMAKARGKNTEVSEPPEGFVLGKESGEREDSETGSFKTIATKSSLSGNKMDPKKKQEKGTVSSDNTIPEKEEEKVTPTTSSTTASTSSTPKPTTTEGPKISTSTTTTNSPPSSSSTSQKVEKNSEAENIKEKGEEGNEKEGKHGPSGSSKSELSRLQANKGDGKEHHHSSTGHYQQLPKIIQERLNAERRRIDAAYEGFIHGATGHSITGGEGSERIPTYARTLALIKRIQEAEARRRAMEKEEEGEAPKLAVKRMTVFQSDAVEE